MSIKKNSLGFQNNWVFEIDNFFTFFYLIQNSCSFNYFVEKGNSCMKILSNVTISLNISIGIYIFSYCLTGH